MGKGKELLRGIAASKGIVIGTCRVVNGNEEKKMKLQKGEIMVADRTTPPDVPYMAKASGFVTNAGGSLSHTAIVAREMGLPAVCGTVEATKVLKDGQKVVIDGAEGVVYEYIDDGPESTGSPKPAAGSLAEKMQAMASKKGLSIDPAFLDKMKKRG